MGAEFSGPRNRATRIGQTTAVGAAQVAGIVAAIKGYHSTGGMEMFNPYVTLAAMEMVDAIDKGKTPLLAEGLGSGAAGLMAMLAVKLRGNSWLYSTQAGIGMTVVSMGSFVFLRYVGSFF